MSTGFEKELDGFNRFVSKRMEAGQSPETLEASIEEFREYQAQRAKFVEGLQESIAQADAGQSKPLDVDGLMERVAERAES